MRLSHILLATLAALSAGGCMQRQAQPAAYVMDPQTGQMIPVIVQQQQFTQPQYAQPVYQQQSANLYSTSPAAAQQAYSQPLYGPPQAGTPGYAAPIASPKPAAQGRGLFTSSRSAPRYAAPQYVQPQYAQPRTAAGGPYVPAPNYASANYAPTYTLDSGDKLRVVVFGQDGITNSYTVDAGGNVNLPLIGTVPARGYSTQQLSKVIGEKLKQGYVREPHVTVEIEAYRPFFILGEVTNPGQYPYVANLTAETAVAIAGGFAPRASKSKVELTRNNSQQQFHGEVPLNYPLLPGDTVVVKERWF
jgi:protein involved in polysaccharide export with SLBB domain